MDSSGSISTRNWQKMKAFLNNMVRAFHSGEYGARFAIVVYSSKAEVSLKFDDFQGSPAYTKEVIEVIKKLRHQRGSTFIDKALALAEVEVFLGAAGMRPNVPKVGRKGSVSQNGRGLISFFLIHHFAVPKR